MSQAGYRVLGEARLGTLIGIDRSSRCNQVVSLALHWTHVSRPEKSMSCEFELGMHCAVCYRKTLHYDSGAVPYSVSFHLKTGGDGGLRRLRNLGSKGEYVSESYIRTFLLAVNSESVPAYLYPTSKIVWTVCFDP